MNTQRMSELLDQRPYKASSTDLILESLQTTATWEWETFENFFTRSFETPCAAAIAVFKGEFLQGCYRFVSVWATTADATYLGLSFPSGLWWGSLDKLTSQFNKILLGAKDKNFFYTMSSARFWSYRCIMCKGTNGTSVWPVPVTHLADYRKTAVGMHFNISPTRYERIAKEFGYNLEEGPTLVVCRSCSYKCVQCEKALDPGFDVVEVREFHQTRECIMCGKMSLTKVEHPKPSRNTWKAIAHRKDLMP